MVSTVHKFLTITFLAVSIFVFGLNIEVFGAQDTAAEPAASAMQFAGACLPRVTGCHT